MNQTICIVYKPGAYGSFLAWAVERFSAVRKQYLPNVTDDPLLKDGSSHGYASFCKIKTNQDFMQGLEVTRHTDSVWHHQIFAGWPNADINTSIQSILQWMTTFDKLIVVNCENADDHMLCYLRNEATMNRDRWYSMLNISNDSDLSNALQCDIDTPVFDRNLLDDPRLLVINVQYLLHTDPTIVFNNLATHLKWPMCDEELFVSVMTRMQSLQIPYIEKLIAIKQPTYSANTPVEHAIQTYLKGAK